MKCLNTRCIPTSNGCISASGRNVDQDEPGQVGLNPFTHFQGDMHSVNVPIENDFGGRMELLFVQLLVAVGNQDFGSP